MSADERANERMLALLLCFQVAALLVAAFVPFGFDHSSSWGLDFGHFLVLAGLYLVALLSGLTMSARRRRWWLLAGELALPAAFVAVLLTGALGT